MCMYATLAGSSSYSGISHGSTYHPWDRSMEPIGTSRSVVRSRHARKSMSSFPLLELLSGITPVRLPALFHLCWQYSGTICDRKDYAIALSHNIDNHWYTSICGMFHHTYNFFFSKHSYRKLYSLMRLYKNWWFNGQIIKKIVDYGNIEDSQKWSRWTNNIKQ